MVLCGAATVAMLWLTHLSDPGIIPPRPDKGAQRQRPLGLGSSGG
jgi:hypothetical protein